MMVCLPLVIMCGGCAPVDSGRGVSTSSAVLVCDAYGSNWTLHITDMGDGLPDTIPVFSRTGLGWKPGYIYNHSKFRRLGRVEYAPVILPTRIQQGGPAGYFLYSESMRFSKDLLERSFENPIKVRVTRVSDDYEQRYGLPVVWTIEYEGSVLPVPIEPPSW